MLVRLLKENHLFNAFLIPLFGVAFWIGSLLNPEVFPFHKGEDLMPLYKVTGGYLIEYPFFSVLAGLILTIANSLLIVRISIAYQFLRSRSFMPGVIYIILISTFKSLHTLHPVHIAAFILLFVISDLLTTYQSTDSISATYRNSFFIGVSSLFYLPATVILPLVWISNYTFKKGGNWRHVILPVFGFLTPWLITLAILFLQDKSGEVFPDIRSFINTERSWHLSNLKISVPIGWYIFISLLGSLSILRRYDEKKINSRKIFSIFFWMTLLLIGTNLLLKFTGTEIIILISIPFSYFISHYFLFSRAGFFPQLLFTILVAIAILSLFVIE